MAAQITDRVCLLPGQWIRFVYPASCSETIPELVQCRFKVLLAKNDSDDLKIDSFYLMSIRLSLHCYNPVSNRMGMVRLSDEVSIQVLDAGETLLSDSVEGVASSARQYLKALVFLRDKCIGYDPETGDVMTSEELREKLYKQ